jgi:hypothetical protein
MNIPPLLISLGITFLVGIVLFLYIRQRNEQIDQRITSMYDFVKNEAMVRNEQQKLIMNMVRGEEHKLIQVSDNEMIPRIEESSETEDDTSADEDEVEDEVEEVEVKHVVAKPVEDLPPVEIVHLTKKEEFFRPPTDGETNESVDGLVGAVDTGPVDTTDAHDAADAADAADEHNDDNHDTASSASVQFVLNKGTQKSTASSISHITDIQTLLSRKLAPSTLKKLSVAVLRSLAIHKGYIADNDTKYKKADLIKLFNEKEI